MDSFELGADAPLTELASTVRRSTGETVSAGQRPRGLPTASPLVVGAHSGDMEGTGTTCGPAADEECRHARR